MAYPTGFTSFVGWMKSLRKLCLCFCIGWLSNQQVLAENPVAENPVAERLKVPGGEFILEWHDKFGKREQQRIRSWLLYTANSASLLDGAFPTKLTRIELHKIRRGKGPVPWAHTIRHGSPQGIAFHVNPSISLRQFKQDWTATHEFSHLYLPYIGRQHSWLSEGFASYYQNILMMRKGTYDQQQGWQKLKDGFDRGAADPFQAGTLSAASSNMRQARSFKRVYWSGASYFLELDLQLRSRGSSLDKVITAFNQNYRHLDIKWDGDSLVKHLDLAGNTDAFSAIYEQYQNQIGFPDYKSQLLNLGISYQGKKITLAGNQRQEQLRLEISQPPGS